MRHSLSGIAGAVARRWSGAEEKIKKEWVAQKKIFGPNDGSSEIFGSSSPLRLWDLLNFPYRTVKMEAKNQTTLKCGVQTDLELLRSYQNHNQEAGDTLIQGHFGFIRVCARRWSRAFFWVAREDLVQLGAIGFWRAAKTFEVMVDRYFHPWARRWIRSEICGSPEVNADKLVPRGNNRVVKKAVEELMRELWRMPTLEEISKRTKLKVKQVDKALTALARSNISLEDEDGPMEIEDPRQIKKLTEIEDELKETFELVQDKIRRLTPGQRRVIFLYYFSQPTTDEAIAEAVGMNKSAITRRRGRAERTLKKLISGDPRWNPRILNSF